MQSSRDGCHIVPFHCPPNWCGGPVASALYIVSRVALLLLLYKFRTLSHNKRQMEINVVTRIALIASGFHHWAYAAWGTIKVNIPNYLFRGLSARNAFKQRSRHLNHQEDQARVL
ncbi:unnamed protein product [Ixodes persulcatus]